MRCSSVRWRLVILLVCAGIFSLPVMMGCGGGSISTEDDSDSTTDSPTDSTGDGEGVVVENATVCTALEGDFECLDNCPNNLETATIADEGSSYSISFPSSNAEEEMVGSCPDFTITMGNADTYTGTIVFENANLFTLNFTPDPPGATGEAIYARISEGEGEEDVNSIDASLLVGTFVPASDNTFNASLLNKDIVIADACDPSCSLTYASTVYSNCTGTLIDTTLTIRCDGLGILNTTVAVSGEDVTLRLGNINMIDSNGDVESTQTFSYIK